MIGKIIAFSIKNKFIIGLFVAILTGLGIYSLTRLPIDAVPDITNNQVQVISIAPSLAAQEVESLITAPIEVSMSSIPNTIELRSISRLGLSVVTVVFRDNVDIYWARQQIGERLKEAENNIPPGVADIEMAPVSTGLGEIYQYRLAVTKGFERRYTPMELRTIQDWIVRRGMLGTPGVAEINSYGGFVKQYEVAVNRDRLQSMNLTLSDIFEALEMNNENTGSAYIDKNPTAFFIRGIGLAASLDDVEKIVVRNSPEGIPILIRDVATVQYGNAPRYGAFVVDTSEAVGGVVMMLKGENAHEIVDNVEKRIASIQKSLPEGVSIEPYLDRSDLVGRAIRTVSRNLIEGALIVIFILVLLLGNFRAGLIVASVIPLSMLFAISLMNIFGISGNLMSLGAIDFGLIVDGAVIIVESVVHRITTINGISPGNTVLTKNQMDNNVMESSSRMMNSATFGQIIILIVFLPIMALVGIEGKMFRPMAQVVILAMIGAIILSLTWVPMASAFFLSRKTVQRRNFSDRIMDAIYSVFKPVISYALRRKLIITVTSFVLFIFSIVVFTRLGGEFIPQLEEGDLAAGVITLQGGSLSHTIEMVKKANKILIDSFPEVKHAVCKIGAAEIPTDPTPMETGDYIITLKDKNEWTSATTREELVGKMQEKLAVLAGVKFEFQQPIQMRFNELMSGSKQDVAIKVFGDNLIILEEKAKEVEKIIQPVEGVEDINVEKVAGLGQIQVEYNRDRMAQYGVTVADLNKVLKAAFAGSSAGVIYDGEKRFDLVVRLDRDYRRNLEDVKSLTLSLPGGKQVPFDQLAEITVKSGPAQVSRENTQRRISVGFNVRGRDVEGVINEVSAKIDSRVVLPEGYYVSFGGQFENLREARKRLMIAVPVALGLILVLLYFTFHSVKQSLLIFTAVPLAVIGGVFALWVRGMNFSISAGVGFIALFGVAVLNGIVLISEFNRLEKEGASDIYERVRLGIRHRFRPVIMTAAVAALGFLPMAVSTSAGAEVQKPLATVVIGGLITSTLLKLVVLPVFYIIFSSQNKFSLFPMRNKKRILAGMLLLPFLLVCQTGKSQAVQKVSVKEAVQIALDSNLAIRSAGYSVEMNRSLRGASWDIPKTEIEGQYGQFNSYSRDNSFTISQSFAFPSLYVYQNKLINAETRSSEFEHQSTSLEISSQVKQVYWQLSFLYSKLKLLNYQDSLYSHFLRIAEYRANSGETSKLEMITARSQSLEVRNQIQEISADLSVLQRRFQNLLNVRTPVTPADTVLHALEFSLLESQDVLGKNPSLSNMKQKVEIARLEKKVENNKLVPDISLGYFSQTMLGDQEVEGVTRAFGPGDRFNGFQAGITLPIWFVPYSSKAKAAKLNERIAITNAEYYSKLLSENYRSLVDDYNKYLRSVRYFELQAVPEANLIIDQSDRSYQAGAMDYLEYVLSLNRALSIRHGYLEALNNLNQTIVQIENITGKIL